MTCGTLRLGANMSIFYFNCLITGFHCLGEKTEDGDALAMNILVSFTSFTDEGYSRGIVAVQDQLFDYHQTKSASKSLFRSLKNYTASANVLEFLQAFKVDLDGIQQKEPNINIFMIDFPLGGNIK